MKNFLTVLEADFWHVANLSYCGSRLQNPKGKQLYKALTDNRNGLEFLSPRQLTYWPTGPRKTPHLINFAITKNIDRSTLSAEVSYDLCSDHSAITVTPLNKTLTNQICKQDTKNILAVTLN